MYDPFNHDNKRKQYRRVRYEKNIYYSNIAIALSVIIGVILFGLFLLGVYVSKDGLDATSKATVAMHDDTVKMKKDVAEAYLNFKSKFLPNQEEVSMRQVLNTIQNIESITDGVKLIINKSSPDLLDRFIVNLNEFITVLTGLLNKEVVDKLVDDFGILVSKVTDVSVLLKEDEIPTLINNISYLSGNASIALSKTNPDDVSKVISNLNRITSTIESDHIIDRVNNITMTLNDILNHLKELHSLQINI